MPPGLYYSYIIQVTRNRGCANLALPHHVLFGPLLHKSANHSFYSFLFTAAAPFISIAN